MTKQTTKAGGRTQMLANRKYPNTGGWQERHDAAIANPNYGFERAIVPMLKGWQQYASEVELRYGSKIGDDGVLGYHFQAIGEGLLGLLNGELGRLDAGTLDAFIRDTLAVNNCKVGA